MSVLDPPSNAQAVLSIDHVAVHFGELIAISDMSFSVNLDERA